MHRRAFDLYRIRRRMEALAEGCSVAMRNGPWFHHCKKKPRQKAGLKYIIQLE